MKVEYTISLWDEDDKSTTKDIETVLYNAFRGYSEQKISKLVDIAQLLIIDFLERHPEKIQDIAYSLELEGKDYKVVND